MLLDMSVVEPVKRKLNSKFQFRCSKKISCFTECCSRANIILTPYDIVRMKDRLGITSGDFLRKYTYTHVDEASLHPYAVLKMMDDNEGKCPFLAVEGCSIYEDRPSNCRFYPVGEGVIVVESEEGPKNEEFYFFIRDPRCLGHKEDTEWTIESWRKDQGADLYDEMNREWKEIQLRRNTDEKPDLDSKKQSMMYMASYDLEKFKRFIFESKLLDVLEIDKEEIEKIKTDEIALMKFGFKYLKYILMLEETLKVREEHKREEQQTEAEDLGSPVQNSVK